MNRSTSFEKVPIEKVREFWDARPCNLRHSPKPVGSREYFDDVDHRKYFVEPHILEFAEHESWAGKRVLEIGCGLGTDTIRFAKAGAQVTAIDLSSVSLDLATRRAEVFGLSDRVRFYEGNCEDLDKIVPIETYDLIYSFGVIHHTPHPERALAALRHYMNAKSELRLMVYSKVSYKLFHVMHHDGPWSMAKLDETMARHSEAQSGCPVTWTYTYDEARKLLQGFDVLDMQKRHIFTWDIPSYVKFEYKPDSAWEGVSAEQLRALESELGWHLLIRARRGFDR